MVLVQTVFISKLINCVILKWQLLPKAVDVNFDFLPITMSVSNCHVQETLVVLLLIMKVDFR